MTVMDAQQENIKLLSQLDLICTGYTGIYSVVKLFYITFDLQTSILYLFILTEIAKNLLLMNA